MDKQQLVEYIEEKYASDIKKTIGTLSTQDKYLKIIKGEYININTMESEDYKLITELKKENDRKALNNLRDIQNEQKYVITNKKQTRGWGVLKTVVLVFILVLIVYILVSFITWDPFNIHMTN